MRITRHFATIGGRRQVHYRRAGSGPPVILLHQSPTSSREYIPLIQELAGQGLTVIAPDTPGNGMSDALPGLDTPEMHDFADAVVELMTELGIDRAPIYGFHTGGVCVLALGLRHPDRVTVAIMDGYVQLAPEFQAEVLANYLPRYQYDWSGSHLTWAWARIREQLIFFPWYRKDTASRMDYDLPPASALQVSVMDFLRAGDNYRKAYRAAFAFDCPTAVTKTRANMVVTTSATDVLAPCMDLMPPVPPNVRTLRPKDPEESRRNVVALLRENPSPQPGVAKIGARPLPGRVWADYLQLEDASLYCRRNTEGVGRPIVMIHASASSSLGMDRYMQPLIGKRPLLAVDLPGNGESDNPMGTTVTVEAQARYLAQAIDAAGYDEVDVFGHWGGCCVALELALQRPGLVKHLAVPTLMQLDDATRDEYLEKYAPAIEFEEYGAHLVRAWNMLRDQELYTPWFKRDRAHIRRRGEPDIDPAVMQRRVLDLFKCLDIYQAAYRAHFSYPSRERLTQLACPVLLDGPQSGDTPQAMAAHMLAFFDA